DQGPAEGGHRGRDRARPRAAACHGAPLGGGVARGHGEEAGDGGEGIHDEEDRREDEQQLFEERDHSATCTTRSLPARFASYIACSARRSSSSTPLAETGAEPKHV